MLKTSSSRDAYTYALNKMIEIFTAHSETAFEDVMSSGLRPVADAVGVHRIAIFQLLPDKNNRLGQTYVWSNGKTDPLDKELIELPDHPSLVKWVNAMKNGETYNGRVDKMNEEDAAFLSTFRIRSIFMVPIFTHNKFWGFVGLEDQVSYRYFDEDDTELLRSAALLCANAFIRNEITQNTDKAVEALKRREKLASALNSAAIIFLSQSYKTFEDTMTAGVFEIANIIGLDRMSIWRNFNMPDGLHASQIYRWDRDSGGTTDPTPSLKDATYSNLAPRWEKIFPKGETVNGPIDEVPEADMLRSLGVVSAFVTPMFFNNAFWGFVLFEDRHKKRYFEKDYVEMMCSAAFLCTNEVLRAEMELKIHEQSQLMGFRLKQQRLLSEISKDFISNSDPVVLINEVLVKLGKNLNVNRMFILNLDVKNTDSKIVYEWYESSDTPRFRFNPSIDFLGIIETVFPRDLPKDAVALAVACEDVFQDTRFASLSKDIDLTSFIYAPLYIDGSLWGIITAENCFAPHKWSKDEISFLAMSSTILAGVIMRNIRDVKLKETLNKVTNLSKAKDEFLSKISHEIRTPMNAILGITEIQLQDEIHPQRKEALKIIYNSGESLLRIINDLLDLSKIEVQKLEIIPARYDIASLINDTVQLNIVQTDSKPIKFKLSVDENVPAELYGDELKIKQVLNNILSNAFKYTDSGEISMSVSVGKCENKNFDATLIFTISDTGHGMTEDQTRKIFDEYSRFNLTGSPSIEGTGLGMTITRNLANLMCGSIFVESELGKGSVFTVHLPQKVIGKAVLGKEMVENLQKFRLTTTQIKKMKITHEPMPYGSVLVVDDVESNIYVAKHLLIPYDLAIDTALSGFEAIDKIKSGKAYDIVFMDHMMPKMDGIETVKKIRDMGYKGTIVALTANAVIGQSEVFMQNGFDAFISKPINTMQLDAELNKFIRDKQPPEVIAEALKSKGKKAESADVEQKTDAALLAIFVRDAKKVLPIFESTLKNADNASKEELQGFAIRAHAMKSALANIGEAALSKTAFALEKAGKEGNKNAIKKQTQKLIDSLKKIIAEIEATKENLDKDENTAYLLDQLKIIIEACINYDSNTADSAIENLKSKPWSIKTEETIDKISEHLLHSDFEEAQAVAEAYAARP